MGEKKRHNQSSNKSPGESGSSESEGSRDHSTTSSGSKGKCLHIKKAVDQSGIRKNTKTGAQLSPFTCSICTDGFKNTKGGQLMKCDDPWVCLKCGICCCGPKEKNHIEIHISKPRSDSHAIALGLKELIVMCFQCKTEIPSGHNKRIGTVVKSLEGTYLKHSQSISNEISHLANSIETDEINQEPDTSAFLASNSNDKIRKNPFLNMNLPKVGGLANLGNTCFFNSVLQCLAQTHGLVELLREMESSGERVTIPVKDSEPINAELDKGIGAISETLASVLLQVSGVENVGSGDRYSYGFVVNPKQLLFALIKKCPQFEGGDQHDAHELLRHLLDSVRMEDLRRYHRAILSHVGLSSKECPKEMDAEKKNQAKALNQQVCETITIRPDHLFKGQLVSRLVCQKCYHSSERLESFLDLSLPVTPEKPQPPSVIRRKNQIYGDTEHTSKLDDYRDEKKSRMDNYNKDVKTVLNEGSKRGNKSGKRNARFSNYRHESLINEDNQKSDDIIEDKDTPSVAEPSDDADIEDNEDGGCEEQEQRLDVLESGYSSEKQASTRTSPLTHSPGEDSDSVFAKRDHQKRSESGLGSSTVSIQELAVTIPDESPNVHSDIASPNSVKANASLDSQELSLDSLQNCCDNRNDDISIDNYSHILPSDNYNSNTLVCSWDCNTYQDTEKTYDFETDNVKSFLQNSNDSSSISVPNTPPEGGYNVSPSSQETNADSSSKESPESQQRVLFNESLNNSLKENKENETEERPVSRLEFHESVARSSPVDLADPAGIDSAVLNLQLEYYKNKNLSLNNYENIACESHQSFSNSKESDDDTLKNKEKCQILQNESDKGFVLVGNIVEKKYDSFEKTDNFKLTVGKKSPTSEEASGTHSTATLAPRYKCEEGGCSLQSCLSQFTTNEILTGNNEVGCDTCTAKQAKAGGGKENKVVYTTCTKQLLISSLPPIMIFHFKRFQMQMCSFRKITRHVFFPVVLDIAPFCSPQCRTKSVSPDQSQILYSLYAVVEHMGTLHGGHYVAYVKVRSKDAYDPTTKEPKPGKWYYISDSSVSLASEERVLKSQAYLLFYERFP
uniref:Uncharacterized protein n=1 Tax=Clastoptera arizonana TaxID=38151 RepID=A0A1B6EAV3_9HEMI